MEKAKELIAELQADYEVIENLTDQKREDLKIEVNTLLHTYLPSNITIGQMETLAVVIHHIIVNPTEYLTPQQSE